MKTLKFSLITLFLAAILFSCEQAPDNQFTLKVNITGTPDLKIFLKQYKDGEGWVTHDTAVTVNGLASFTGTIDIPEMYFISFENTRSYVQVFLESGTITANMDFENLEQVEILGSESHRLFKEFEISIAEIDDLFRELNRQMQEAAQNNDTELMSQLETEFDELNQMKTDYIKNFCMTNNTTVVSPYIMYRNSYYFGFEDFDELLATVDPSIQNSVYVAALQARADVLRKVAVGQPFTDFTLSDPEGNPVPLSSVIGQNYVLVDFWASWCGPCRRENPNIVAAYEKFHDKGFDVFGVSLDRDHAKWLEAIENDQLTWNHVSDLQFWNSAAGKLYGVNSIPHSVLISPEGIIVAKNLREEELHTKLGEYLN